MSISDVVTRGYAIAATIAKVVLRGYVSSEPSEQITGNSIITTALSEESIITTAIAGNSIMSPTITGDSVL